MPTSNAHHGKTAGKPAPESNAARGKAAAKPEPEREPARPPKPENAIRRPKLDLTAKLLHTISEAMAIEEAELTPNASFKEDLNLDELDIVELFMQAEQTLKVTPFNDEDWESCETVGDFVKLVEQHVAAAKARAPRRE